MEEQHALPCQVEADLFGRDKSMDDKKSKILNLHLHYEEGPQNTKKDIKIKTEFSRRWEDIVQGFKNTLNISSDELWAFQYFDDEGNCVMGKSEYEWRAALEMADVDAKPGRSIHVEAIPLGEVKWNNECGGSAKSEAVAGKCCPAKESLCCKEKGEGLDCQFPCKRPIQELNFDLNREAPTRIQNKTQSEYKYTGEALRAVALPLGPIGQGSISIAGDGGLRQWQINNKISHDAHVPDSFFAIRVDTNGTSKSIVLQSSALYDDSKFQPAPYISDHYVPPASKQLLTDLPGVKTIEVTAKFPVVHVDYTSDEVPLKVEMDAWSPKIPLDAKNSGIPVIVFNFTVTNKTGHDATVSLLGTLQNIAGWNCYDNITNEVDANGYGGNVNSLYTTKSLFGIDMSNPSLASNHAFNGHVACAFLKQDSDKLSTMLQFNSAKDLWKYFTGDGLPGQGFAGPSKTGSTWNGAIACERTVKSGTSTVFTYMLAWHFPNRYRDWKLYTSIPNTPLYVGNKYNKFWTSVAQVLDYTAQNFSNLQMYTVRFRDAMFNTTTAWQIIDSAANRIGLLNSPTCFWAEDGYFYAFEGCSKGGGCCPLNCTHVWNYEQCLARLYPELERSMREIDLFHQINPYGVIPSRTSCPLELQRVWQLWDNYTTNQNDTNICVDGEIGTVLKAYREVKIGAPKKWFDSIWGPVKKIMSRWMNELDSKGDGLITVAQPNTYDTSTYGVTTFIGAYYLCALRATEEMAKLQGDAALQKLCRDRFEIGSKNLDKECFVNGKWYTQCVDPAHEVELLSDSSFMDALVGQWWAHSLGLGYLLPAEHIKSNLQYAAARNFVKSFDPAKQYPRKFADQRDSGYFLAFWDEGPPKNQLLYSSEFCWSGVLHAFVGLCFYEGLDTIGINALTSLRQCYDGTRRSPWNEIECGDYYARAMAAYLYFEIATGQEWEYVTETAVNVKFAPRITPEAFKGFFILGAAWGQYSQIMDSSRKSGVAKIQVQYGSLELSELRLNSSTTSCLMTLDEKVVSDFKIISKAKDEVSLQFPKTLAIHDGQSLTINFLG
ncbi:uncharacterized protein LOC135695054 [Rhopilema esculentum]|uniref:uncharacterized protein LOC135695054 n=1 Tax=Rhopilema esculentum TaxID=499914 RepID=UPI0031D1476E